MRVPFLLISIIFIAVQTASVAVYAESNNAASKGVIALAQPSSAQAELQKNALVGQASITAIENQFVPGIVIYGSHFGADEATRLARDGVFIGPSSSSNYIELQGGNMLVAPEKDLVVGTQSGKVRVGGGAFVFVVDSGEDTVVYDLLQTKPKQVVVTANKSSLIMEPGRMLVLTKQGLNDFEQLSTDCHRVGYRNAQLLKNSGEVKVFAADFSLASAMIMIEPLKRLTLSGNKADKLAMEKMIRGAVLLGGFFADACQPDAAEYPLASAETNSTQANPGNNKAIALSQSQGR